MSVSVCNLVLTKGRASYLYLYNIKKSLCLLCLFKSKSKTLHSFRGTSGVVLIKHIVLVYKLFM